MYFIFFNFQTVTSIKSNPCGKNVGIPIKVDYMPWGSVKEVHSNPGDLRQWPRQFLLCSERACPYLKPRESLIFHIQHLFSMLIEFIICWDPQRMARLGMVSFLRQFWIISVWFSKENCFCLFWNFHIYFPIILPISFFFGFIIYWNSSQLTNDSHSLIKYSEASLKWEGKGRVFFEGGLNQLSIKII